MARWDGGIRRDSMERGGRGPIEKAPRKESYRPPIARKEPNMDYDSTLTIMIGTTIIIGAYCVFVFFIYWIVFSKLLPYTNHRILDWLKDDQFYCVLLPILCGPILVMLVYGNWLAMKYFRHS